MYDNPEHKPESRSGFLGWCARHPKTVVALVLASLLLGTCAVVDYQATKSLEQTLDKIRAEGAPVSIADLNAMGGDIPDDENMAIALLAAGKKITAIEVPPEKAKELPLIGTRQLPPTGLRLRPEQMEATRWFLAEHSDALKQVHEALEKERGHIPFQWTTPAMNMDTHDLSVFRHIARTLALQGVVAAEEARTADAMVSIRGILKMDRAFEGNACLLETLVRISIRGEALNAIECVLGVCELDAGSLKDLENQLVRDERRIDFRKVLQVERVITLDTVDAAFSGAIGPGSNSGVSAPLLLQFIPLLQSVGNARGLEAFSAMVDAVDEPDIESLQRLQTASQKMASLPTHCLLWRIVAPSLESSCHFWLHSVAYNRTMRAALACERFRLATGDWPAALADLVPAYLDAVPLDPFDNQPIRYRRIEDGIRVWSIGRDMVDDQGDVRRIPGRRSGDRLKDAGWTLLDPAHRGLAQEPD